MSLEYREKQTSSENTKVWIFSFMGIEKTGYGVVFATNEIKAREQANQILAGEMGVRSTEVVEAIREIGEDTIFDRGDGY